MEINSNIRNKPPTDWISNKNAIASNNVSFASNVVRCFHWLCWLLKNKPCLLHIELAIFETFCLLFFFFSFFSPQCLLSAWWLVTCRSTNHSCGIPLDNKFESEGPRRRISSAMCQCVLGKKCPRLVIFYIVVAYNSYAFLVCVYCCAVLPVLSVLQDVTVEKKKKKSCTDLFWLDMPAISLQTGRGGGWFSTMLWGVEALPSGVGERLKIPVHMESRICYFHLLLFYCEGWGAVLSGLLSWVAGGLLLQGALLPRAGELLKSSSSSRPLVASYCVFSRRVIKRSSSSPNSPPIRVGSPTTITSWRESEGKFTNCKMFFFLTYTVF